MEANEIYSECREFTCGIKKMFNHFSRYQPCLYEACFCAEMNDILRKIALAYRNLTVALGKKVIFNNIIISTVNDDLENMADDNPLFIDQVIESMERNRDDIISNLQQFNHQKQLACLYAFENCFKASQHWINRMEMMLRNSQYLRRTYLQACA